MAFNIGKEKINHLFDEGRPKGIKFFKRNVAIQSQVKTLRILLGSAENTAFGKEHNFQEILSSANMVEAYQKVPLSSYLEMKPYWQLAFNGEPNVCWKGDINYFALSSGTTDATSKYIPVTNKMLKNIKRASLRQLWQIAKSDLPKEHLAKNYLFVGGSTNLEFNGNNFSGDLSGITTSNIPVWMKRFSKPEPHIRNEKEWHHKINLMVEQAPNWDIAMIAGVPAWIQLLFQKIIETYQLKTIHDIWPNLSVYVHGGVSFKPYKNSFGKFFEKPIKYFETYLASEGFIAFQDKEDSKGMRLVFRNGIFYEFVPFDDNNFNEEGNLNPNARAVTLSKVEKDVDYAIVISTCSGAWRYILGDTIRFVDLNRFEIIITGRTKHFLSLCGEHLSVGNMNDALQAVSQELKLDITEFTVKGISDNGKFGHHWYLGVSENIKVQTVQALLDSKLKELNDDYRVERMFALKNMKVTLLKPEVFNSWMESRGKLGSQNKFPRVMNDELFVDWELFVGTSNN